ncbi:hypothetical protein CU098_000941, partial [Rhizopus stolonifer]
ANEALLKQLEIPGLATKRKQPTTTTTDTRKKKPTVKKVTQPTRTSSRLRGKSPDREHREPSPPPKPKMIESLEEPEQSELLAVFKQTLQHNIKPEVSSKSAVEQLGDLKIQHSWRTVKVTPSRIYSCLFHPSNVKLLGCAVDIEGYLGFWDIDQEKEEEPVVYQYKPHTRTITDLKMDPQDDSKILTSSYDGYIKVFDMNHASFETLDLGSTYPISSLDIQQDGHLVWFSTMDGDIGYADRRRGGKPTLYSPKDKKIGCIHINPIHHELIVAGSNDRTATLWDIRNLKKNNPLWSQEHGYSVTSCYWSPKGNKLATTSYDDHIRLFDLDGHKQLHLKSSITHNNHTGRWVTNFRARWNTNRHHALKYQHLVIGNMKQTLDIFGEDGRELIKLYDEDHITAIPSVSQCHPNTLEPTILTGNTSGRMVCWRT